MGERVLIVEDDPATRTGLAELVQAWGFQTDEAPDGEEALKKVKTEKIKKEKLAPTTAATGPSMQECSANFKAAKQAGTRYPRLANSTASRPDPQPASRM